MRDPAEVRGKKINGTTKSAVLHIAIIHKCNGNQYIMYT